MSINITDMDVTPMHVAFEEVKKDAEDLSVAVTGSELVCSLNKRRISLNQIPRLVSSP